MTTVIMLQRTRTEEKKCRAESVAKDLTKTKRN